MKPYLHKKLLQVPLYKAKFLMILSNSSDLIQKEIGDTNIKHEPFCHTLLRGYKGWTTVAVVINFNNKKGKVTMGAIAHECTHASHFILAEREIQADYNNDEPEAYLTTWFGDELHKFMVSKGFDIYCPITRKHKKSPKFQ